MKKVLFLFGLFLITSAAALDINFTNGETHNFDSEFLEARSHFTELDSLNIVLIGKSFSGQMIKSRPQIKTLFGPRENRVYEIIINNDYSKNEGYLFDSVPHDAKIGLFGHELSHIQNYNERSFFGMLSFAIGYLITPERIRVERETDNRTIKHELQSELYSFNNFVLEDNNSPEKYKELRRKYYLSPEEILNFK